MVDQEPVTELGAFSSDDAAPTRWSQARGDLQDAPVYWLSTVRPDGRPHVTPLLGIWLEGAPALRVDRVRLVDVIAGAPRWTRGR